MGCCRADKVVFLGKSLGAFLLGLDSGCGQRERTCENRYMSLKAAVAFSSLAGRQVSVPNPRDSHYRDTL